METAAPRRSARLLVAVIALSVAATGGVVARALTDDAAAAGEPGSAIVGAARFEDLHRMERRGFVGPDRPAVELPVPEPAPSNPYAFTPELRHGTLEIPAIGLSQPLFEGVTLTAINRGPSHWPGTAMPGELGNVVVAGHRTTYTRPFWDLDRLKPGDALVFAMADGDRHVYELDRLEIVDPQAIHIVEQTYAHRATLFACHPKGSARQRIVAHFTLVTSQQA